MNLGSYFQSALQEINGKEGLHNDPYNILYQSQNQNQRLTKKQISDKERKYEQLLNQIDSQDDPMSIWEEYLDFLFTHMDENSLEESDKIFQALEQFTRYSVEREYIKQDNRGARFWIEYSNMCKDKEDVIQYMEENEIGLNSALFYEEICQITESKMDYKQADKYVLEGKYKQAQPEDKISDLIQNFEKRMEERIQKLRELASLQMFHQNQQSNQKKRKRIEFDMNSRGLSNNYSYNQQNYDYQINQNGKKNNSHSTDFSLNDIYQNGPNMRQNIKSFQNKENYSFHAKKQKKKLPDKVYIGDGINIFVDEEYRQQVFPNSTQLVSEYQSVMEEVKEYLDSLPDAENGLFQSQQQNGQSYFNLSQRQFQSQTMNNSQQLSSKNKIALLNALGEDMHFPKKSVLDCNKSISWIGREEKKYKSFELMESQKNSQVVQTNMCDFLQGSSLFSPTMQAEYYLDIYYNNNPQNKNDNNNQNNSKLNKRSNSFNCENEKIDQKNTNRPNIIINQDTKENKIQDDNYSQTPVKSQKEEIGIMECESELFKNGWAFSQSKMYSELKQENKQNQQRNKRLLQRNLVMQSTSPLQISNKRTSQRYNNNEDSANFQKLDDGNQKQQSKWNTFDKKGDVTPSSNGISAYGTKQKANEIQYDQNSRFSQSFSKDKYNDNFNVKQNNLNNIFENLNNNNRSSMTPCNTYNKTYAEDKSLANISLSKDLYSYTKDIDDDSNLKQQQFPNYQQKQLQFRYKQFQDYKDDQVGDISIDYSNLNKAYNDISKFTDDDDDQYSSDCYSDNYQFMKNHSKNTKLSYCIRSKQSSKFKANEFLNSEKTQNQLMIDSPVQNKKPNPIKNNNNNNRSIEKLRKAHQIHPQLLNVPNIHNPQNSSIQFSQEFSQVNNILTQEGFFSPCSFDDNIFKINPPPIMSSRKYNKNKKHATKKVNFNQDSESEGDIDDDEKSLTEKEDEEINEILDKYCFNNENINEAEGDTNTNNIFEQLQEKENQNLIINQRRSKSQISKPRKALQSLPIVEFTGEPILDNQILSLNQSYQNNDDIHGSQINSPGDDNVIYYSHNQFRNSRNRITEEKIQIINDDFIDKEFHHKFEYILSNSIYKDEFLD